MDQAKKDESTSQDPVDEILEAFYHEDLQAEFDSDGDEWLDEGDQDRLESSSTCSSMGTHSETDEEATSFYRLYGDSMSESSSVISDPPLETEDSDDEDFATNAPPAFIRDELSYNPENEDVRSDFPSLSCLNTSPASAIPRPPKMTSRLSTDTIKIRSRENVLT